MKVCLKTDEFPSLTLLPTTPAVALLLIVVTAEVDIAQCPGDNLLFCVKFLSLKLVLLA